MAAAAAAAAFSMDNGHDDDNHDTMSVQKSLRSMRSNFESTRSFRTVSVGNPDLKEPLTGGVGGGAMMMMTTTNHYESDDPFYVFREDLYRKLDLVDDGLAEFLRLVHQTVRH